MEIDRTSFLIGAMALVMVACSTRHGSEPLTNTLETYKEKDAQGEWTLTGVYDIEVDTVVVKPDSYQSITADQHFITCIKKVGDVEMHHVFRLNGEPVGCFESFSHWTMGVDYYFGVNRLQKYYYFPKTRTSIQTTDVYSELPMCLCLRDGEEWKVLTYDGEQLLNLTQDATLVLEAADHSVGRFCWLKEEQGKLLLYDIMAQKTIHEVAVGEWREPQASEIVELPSLTILKVPTLPIPND